MASYNCELGFSANIPSDLELQLVNTANGQVVELTELPDQSEIEIFFNLYDLGPLDQSHPASNVVAIEFSMSFFNVNDSSLDTPLSPTDKYVWSTTSPVVVTDSSSIFSSSPLNRYPLITAPGSSAPQVFTCTENGTFKFSIAIKVTIMTSEGALLIDFSLDPEMIVGGTNMMEDEDDHKKPPMHSAQPESTATSA